MGGRIHILGVYNNKKLWFQHYSQTKKTEFQLNTIRGKELIKDALEMRKEMLLEKRDVLVKDIRQTKLRVQEKVKEKMEHMEEIVERENVLTIPNLLCVGRGLLAPYLSYVIIIQEDFSLGMGLLMFAGFTDLVWSSCEVQNLMNISMHFYIIDGWLHCTQLAITGQ